MKIAYVVSGMKLSFVVNEMEAHEQAGWEILPLASCRPESSEGHAEVTVKWCKRAVYRSNAFAQIWTTLQGMVTHPLRFLQACLWTLGLLIRSPSEFAKAVYELTTSCDFSFRCKRFGVKHIHVHLASRSLSLGLILGILTGLPVSCTVHAFDIFTRSPGSLRTRLAKCKFIAAVSRFNVEHLNRICGKAVADLCHIVHCGVDVEKFRSISRQPEPGRMVCVARLDPKKGLDMAIAACANLRESDAEFVFQIIGDGPERKRLEQQISQLGLEDCVVLLGRKANDQLVPFFSKACLFLMPCARTETGDMDGIPVAMMEAMACEVPVVSRRISGIPELVHHGVNGLLVHDKDPGALANAIETLLADQDKIRQFGRAGRKQIEQNFNITKTAAQLRELISSD